MNHMESIQSTAPLHWQPYRNINSRSRSCHQGFENANNAQTLTTRHVVFDCLFMFTLYWQHEHVKQVYDKFLSEVRLRNIININYFYSTYLFVKKMCSSANYYHKIFWLDCLCIVTSAMQGKTHDDMKCFLPSPGTHFRISNIR